jgi:uncharacterized protein
MYALVTGGSKGIGKEIALQLAAKKYPLILVARSRNLLEEVATEITQKYGTEVQIIATDLSEPNAASDLAQQCRISNWSVSVLINNAGYGLSGKFTSQTLANNRNMLQLNITFLTEMCQEFIPIIKANGPGHILNVASTAAYQAMPNLAAYAASKTYVLSFSRALNFELKDHNINVSCLCPGGTNTDFAERAGVGPEAIKQGKKFNMSPDTVAKIAVEGMLNKKPEIIPGLLNKVGAWGAWLLPKIVSEKVSAKIFES